MKVMLIIILLIAGVIGFMLFGGRGKAKEPGAAQVRTTEQSVAQEQGTKTQQQPATGQTQQKSTGHSLIKDVGKVADYSIGYTQFKIGQTAKKRAKAINAQHQKELEKAMQQ